MIALIYEYTGDVSRSIVGARLVGEVEIDEVPDDEAAFAVENGGDFIQIMEPACG